jgi:dihydrofolate reductase
MRKIIAGFAASLDGYIEGPNGEYDWILIDKEIDFAGHMKRFDTYFFGRITYEKIGTMTSKPTPGITNYVFSHTLKTVNKNYRLIDAPIKEQVEAIKQQEGKDIAVFGGANLLASLLDLALVDEISVAIIPVLLGKGKPMVDLLRDKVWLSLLSSKTYSNGTLQVTYQVTNNHS